MTNKATHITSEEYNILSDLDKTYQAISWASNIYFVGIGGIGMSALARYFVASKKQVAGYDKTPSTITDALIALGINIHFEDSIKAIQPSFLNPETTLVVFTPAIPESHTTLRYFKSHNFKVLKRSEVLGLITKQTKCLAVAGTHGKTTTTSILGHLLNYCNVPVTAFLGGISENYNSNLILNGTDVTVVEADEFDRSFLTLSPDFACITSMDADHLDIYGDASALENAFKDFVKCIKPNGKLFIKNGLPLKGITYGIEDDSTYCAQNIRIANGTYNFDVKTPTTVHKNFKLSLPGRHNLVNALVALAMALEYGCTYENLKNALAQFKGVKRRFTYHIKTNDFVYIDDYAHHPEELNAVHNAVREMHPNKKVLAVFQPHLFSRTQDFADAFAKSLAQFDALLLLDIYPARELPILGVTSKWLLEKVIHTNKKQIDRSALISEIKASGADVVLTLGAGDIGTEVERIKKAFYV